MSRESFREVVAFLILGVSAFLFVSVFTHDPLDTLERGEVRNLCGPAGAWTSAWLTRWVGKAGAHGTAALLGAAGLSLFFRRSIAQWGWKIGGGLLFVVTLCCFEVAVFDLSGGAEVLPGGYYGQFFHSILLENLSSFGCYMILALSTLVAFVISTDTVLYPALARSGEVVLDRERWKGALEYLREKTPSPRDEIFSPLKRFLAAPALRARLRRSRARAAAPARPKNRAAQPAAPASDRTGEENPSGPERKAPAPAAPRRDDLEDPLDVRTTATEVRDEGASGTEAKAPPPEEPPRPGPARAVRREPESGSAAEAPDAFRIREPDPIPRPRKRPGGRSRPGPYRLPALSLIDPSPEPVNFLDKTALSQTARKIESTLRDFKIEARVVEVQKGPTITQFELSLAAGIKVHKITNLADDLAMALKAQSIRIIAPIPGKSTVGIEVPNETRSTVGLRELLEYLRPRDQEYSLPLALGRDTAGNPVIGDLGEMPHLLIAGSTGSGKSVCINSVITSILMTRTPEEVKLILLDPKMVELAQFESIPHLLSPVVTDMKKAPAVLNWLVDKMEERYEILALAGVRHLTSYNALGRGKLRERLAGKLTESEIEEMPENLPFVVVIIDELADLMMTAAKEVEGSITRLSQKSRAVGIHVILATQRPSVDVITGLIKANMPSRISFRVTSRVDSRTILDRNGAEKLLGKGDMLYTPPGTSDVVRVQGAFISDGEIREVVQASAREAEPQYNSELTRFGIEGAGGGEEEDDLFDEAVGIVLGSQRGSVTLLQRQLQIGYTRASRLMELMHERGLVGPFKGSKAREVYYTLEEWEKSKARNRTSGDESD